MVLQYVECGAEARVVGTFEQEESLAGAVCCAACLVLYPMLHYTGWFCAVCLVLYPMLHWLVLRYYTTLHWLILHYAACLVLEYIVQLHCICNITAE